MKLSLKGMAFAGGLLWGSALLFLGLIHLASPGYAVQFLDGIASVYPWFHAGRSAADVLVGAIDGLIDGAVAGFLFGWLYNIFA
jgi:hypothetical protein